MVVQWPVVELLEPVVELLEQRRPLCGAFPNPGTENLDSSEVTHEEGDARTWLQSKLEDRQQREKESNDTEKTEEDCHSDIKLEL